MDKRKKQYTPQTLRDMNTYTPQTQMSKKDLEKKAYGMAMQSQIMQMAAAKKAAVMQEVMQQRKAQQIAGAVDGVLAENVQLKKQINLNEIQLEKSNTINQARQKPVEITKKRTGK
jgi:exonuclease V gamma subunit